MKIREKSRALCILECVCHTAFEYMVVSLIWYMVFGDSAGINIRTFLMVAVSDGVFYIFRQKLHKSWEIYGVLVVYIALLVMLAGYFGGAFLLAGIVVSIFYLVIVWSNSLADFEKPSAIIAALLFIVGLWVWLLTVKKLLIIFYICEAVYVFSLIIYKNLKSADDFIWQNRRTAFLSAEQIKNANYLITSILGAGILAAATTCAILFSPLLNLLKQPIQKLLADVFGADVLFQDTGGILEDEIKEIEPYVGELAKNDSPGSLFVMLLINILGVISLVLLVIFIIYIIRQLSGGINDGDIKEYIIPYRKNEASSVDKENEEMTDDKPAKKIRKLYKKTIKSNLKKNCFIPKASTPNEQKKLAGLSGEWSEKFVELYHKARYSDEECTEADVEKMKSYK